MEPAAVLAVVVKAQGVGATNAQLMTVQKNLEKTEAAGAAMATRMKSSGATAVSAGKKMTKGLTAPILGVGVASVLLSRQFGGAMRLISTQAGASRKEMEKMKHSVLDLASSGKVKQTPKELADALFHIESVGFRGSKALKVLKSSADLATLGQSDMETTTYALVSALETGIKGTENLTKTVGTMNAIVGAGDLRMEELAESLSSGVLISAHQVGLSIEDVGAALDTMTARGMPARVAATRLRMTFTLMAAPTDKAKKSLKGIGLDSEAMAKKMQGPEGLIGALRLLKEHMDGLSKVEQTQLLSEAFGGARSGTTMMALIQNLTDVEDRLKHIKQTSSDVKEKLHEATSTPGFKLDAAVSQLESTLIKLGDQILPVVVPAIQTLAAVIAGVGTVFSLLPHQTQKWIVVLGLLLAAAGPLLVIYGKLAQALGTFILWIYRNVTATEVGTVANTELAASYAEVAAAAEAAAAAQATAAAAMEAETGQMAMMMPEAAAGGQLSLLGTNAAAMSAEAEAAGVTAGGAAAGGFATGLAAMIPFAIAGIGLANILSSVVGGDTEGALFKVGGAGAGALVGGLAFGLPGALVGAGLGSIVGGFVGKLFDKDPSAFAKRNEETIQSSVAAHKHFVRSSELVIRAEKKLKDVGEAQARVTHKIKHAQERLADARKSGNTRRISREEARLNELKAKQIHLTHRQWHAETLLHAAHVKSIADARRTRKFEVELIHVRDAQLEQARKRVRTTRQAFEQAVLQNKPLKDQNEKERALIKAQKQRKTASHKLSSAEKELGGTMKEISQKFGEKFADHLRKTLPLWGSTKEQIRSTEKFMRKMGLSITPISEQMRNFGHRGSKATGDTKRGFEKVTKVLGPFRNETRDKLGKARDDVNSWKKANVEGVATVKGNLQKFAKELGISKVTFHAGAQGKKAKRQTGGMVVPGAGTGDKVPLTAMVEPGEVVHVLNMRASKDIAKLEALEHLNEQVPRHGRPHRQAGGVLGVHRNYAGLSGDTDFYSEMGFALSKMATGTQHHIDVASGYRSIAEQAALYQKYKEGVGNLAAPPSPNAPHVKGYAADISPDRGTFGGVAGNYGLGFTVPSEAWHIELLNAAHGATGRFAGKVPKMPKMLFTGPEGELQALGQKTMDRATAMAQQFLNKNAGGGVGNVALGPVVKMAREMVINMWGSSQWPAFNALEMSEAGWNPRAQNPSSGAAGLAQALPPSKYPPGAWPYTGLKSAMLQLKWMTGYIKERYGTPESAWAFHQANNYYKEGGMLELKKGGSSLSKSMKHILKGLSSGKHLPKYHAALKKFGKRIDGIGLSDSRIQRMGDTTKDIEKFAEYASNASALTVQDEGGGVIQGMFKGRNEGAWLNEQLGSLLRLRNEVIAAHGTIEDKQLPRINQLLKQAKDRLNHVRKAIREAEQKKRELEKQIKEIEKAQNTNKHALEKQLNQLEADLQKAQNAKNPDKAQLERIRGEIHTTKEAISGNDQQATGNVHKIHAEIQGIEKAQKGRRRVESALSSNIIPGLTGKQGGMHETMANLFGDGGEVNGIAFLGLQQIQGAGGPLDDVPNPPEIGTLGGEIFNVQNRLREIDEESKRARETGGESESAQEIAQLNEELAMDWKKRYLVSQSQYSALSSFPTAGEVAAIPSAGSFALGGVISRKAMAWVGERGPEPVFAPEGARVIPSHEAQAALAKGGRGDVNFEEVHFHEAEEKVTGRANGHYFEKDVKYINRKQARKSMAKTPGGKGLRDGLR